MLIFIGCKCQRQRSVIVTEELLFILLYILVGEASFDISP